MTDVDNALLRHLKILRLLGSRRNGATVKELTEEFGVSTKTIRRDLEIFAAAGFAISENKEERGRKSFVLDARHAAPQVGFTFDEALALCLVRQLLGPLSGTLMGSAARSAIAKVRACLGRDVSRYIDKMLPRVHATSIGVEDYARKAEIIDQLLIGMEDRQVVFITYQSQRATESVTYDVHPYGLTIHRGALYLIGFAPQHDEIRHWKVSRIEAAEVDVMPFTMPTGFKVDEHLAGCFGIFHGKEDVHVKIRFSKTVARQVSEAIWHPSQKLTPQPDGSLLADFRLNSTVEVKQWVLSFGPQAEVLEPSELRLEVRKEIAQMLLKYVNSEGSAGDSFAEANGTHSPFRPR